MEAKERIRIYKRRVLFIPGKRWFRYDFLYRSYSRWAADEILDRLQNTPDRNPVDVVREFVDEMDSCYERSKCEKTWQLFAIARDAGKDILDLVETNERRRASKK